MWMKKVEVESFSSWEQVSLEIKTFNFDRFEIKSFRSIHFVRGLILKVSIFTHVSIHSFCSKACSRAFYMFSVSLVFTWNKLHLMLCCLCFLFLSQQCIAQVYDFKLSSGTSLFLYVNHYIVNLYHLMMKNAKLLCYRIKYAPLYVFVIPVKRHIQ